MHACTSISFFLQSPDTPPFPPLQCIATTFSESEFNHSLTSLQNSTNSLQGTVFVKLENRGILCRNIDEYTYKQKILNGGAEI